MSNGYDNHPICADCPGTCCRNWEWWVRPGPEWRAYMAKMGPGEYKQAKFWKSYLGKSLEPLEVVRVTPGLRVVDLRCKCLHHNARTGRCRMYKDRPDTCRWFPGPSNVKKQVGWGCALIDILAAKPAPGDYKEHI